MRRAEVAALCIEAREFQVRGQSGPIKGVVYGNWTWMGLRSVAIAMAFADAIAGAIAGAAMAHRRRHAVFGLGAAVIRQQPNERRPR
jgi:hypothetical protein